MTHVRYCTVSLPLIELHVDFIEPTHAHTGLS